MDFTQQFKATVPEIAQARILKALRQEPVIWNALQNSRFAEKIFSFAKGNPKRWTASMIGMIAMNDIPLAELFEEDIMVALNSATRQKAAAKLAEISHLLNQREILISLADCTLIALSLRERWRLIGNWDEILSELSIAPISFWQPVFTIVYSLIPHPENLVAQLISPKTNQTYQYLAIHTILSNPIEIYQKSDLLINLLTRLSADQQIAHLQRISIFSQSLGEKIAKELQISHKSPTTNKTSALDQVKHYLEQAEYHKLAGTINKSLPLMEKAWQEYTKYHTDLVTQLALTAAKQNDDKTAYKAIENAEMIAPTIQLASIDGMEDESLEIADNNSLWELNSAIDEIDFLISNDEIENAIVMSDQVYQGYTSKNFKQSKLQIQLDVTHRLIKTFSLLCLTNKVVTLAKEFLLLAPNNLSALTCLMEAHNNNNDKFAALETNLLAITLHPNNKSLRTQYIDTLINIQSWDRAKLELETFTNQYPESEEDVYLSLIDCAIFAQDLQLARKSCYTLLEIHPSSINVFTKLGEINLKLSNFEEGINFLNKSITLGSKLPTPWILIAQCSASLGDINGANNQFLMASNIFPSHPEILHAMGNFAKSRKNIPEALIYFQEAYENIVTYYPISEQSEINIHADYGMLLLEQNKIQEASKLLNESFTKFDKHPQIAYPFGKSKLLLNLPKEALRPLQIATKHNSTHIDIQLCLCQVYLLIGEYPTEALQLAESIHDNYPNLDDGKKYLAQAHLQANQPDSALPIYQELVSNPEIQNSEDYFEIICNFSDAAIKLETPEIALMPLKELAENSTNSLPLQMKLAEVYQSANLPFESMKILETLYEKYPEDIDTLLWISDLAIELDNLPLAIQSLEHSLKFSPDNAEILIRLGYAQINNNQLDQAKDSFLKLMNLDIIQSSELEMAANAINQLGETDKSIPLFEKAAEIGDYSSASLLKDLTSLYLKTSQPEKAITSLQKHIAIEKQNISLYLQTAEIHRSQNNLQETEKILTAALTIEPNNPEVNFQMAGLTRQMGNLGEALDHIESAFLASPENDDIQTLAIEINIANLNSERAIEIQSHSSTKKNHSSDWLKNGLEIVLHENNLDKLGPLLALLPDYEQGQILAQGYDIISQSNSGNLSKANSLFTALLSNQNRVIQANRSIFEQATIFRVFSQASLSVHDWALAKKYAKQANDIVSNEPINAWNYAQVLLKQAEFQHFANALEMKTSASENNVFSENTQDIFATLIEQCHNSNNNLEITNKISRLEIRGELAIMNHSPEKISFTPQNDHEAISWISACVRSGLNNIGLATCKPFQHNRIVHLYFALGTINSDPQTSLNHLKQIIKTNINFAPALFLLARAAHNSNDLTLAENSLLRAISLSENEEKWLSLASLIFEKTNRFIEGLAFAEQAVSLSPKNPTLQFQSGRLSNILGKLDNAIFSFEKATELQPQETIYWYALSKAQLDIGDLNQAANNADELISLNPNLVESLMLRCEIAIAANNIQVAENIISEANRINPNHPLILETQAQIFAQQNRTEEAIDLLDQASELTMNPVSMQVQKSNLICKSRGVQEQIDFLQRLGEKYPTNAEILTALSTALLQSGKLEDAIFASLEAIKFEENTLSVKQKIQLHFQLGTLFEKDKQYDLAVEHLTSAIQYNPNLIDAHLSLGNIYETQGNTNMALSIYKNCIPLSPKNPFPYEKAGKLLKSIKNYSEAETMFRKASGLAPQNQKIKSLLSMTQALLFIHKPKEASVSR
jgi:tetratricopeptide (TPR) repeat protein